MNVCSGVLGFMHEVKNVIKCDQKVINDLMMSQMCVN